MSRIKKKYAHDNNYTYNQFMCILQDYQNGKKDMQEVVKEVGIRIHSDVKIINLFRGEKELIEGFVMFLPKNYQYEASMLITQMNTPQQFQPYEDSYIPPYQQPIYQTVQPEYVPERRRTRSSRQVRNPQPVQQMQPASPMGPAPKSHRRAYVEEPEPEPDTLPVSERRFFDRVAARRVREA